MRHTKELSQVLTQVKCSMYVDGATVRNKDGKRTDNDTKINEHRQKKKNTFQVFILGEHIYYHLKKKCY